MFVLVDGLQGSVEAVHKSKFARAHGVKTKK
jgi:hypothetical protein